MKWQRVGDAGRALETKAALGCSTERVEREREGGEGGGGGGGEDSYRI